MWRPDVQLNFRLGNSVWSGRRLMDVGQERNRMILGMHHCNFGKGSADLEDHIITCLPGLKYNGV